MASQDETFVTLVSPHQSCDCGWRRNDGRSLCHSGVQSLRRSERRYSSCPTSVRADREEREDPDLDLDPDLALSHVQGRPLNLKLVLLQLQQRL